MISLILGWLYSLVIFYFYGLIVSRLLFGNRTQALGFSTLQTLITGIVAISTAASIYALFLPIKDWLHIFVIAGICIYYFYNKSLIHNHIKSLVKKFRSLPLLYWVGLGALSGLLAFKATQPGLFNYDEGLYYLPLINLIKEFGMLLGSGNIYFHHGLNSSWFVLAALFKFDFLKGHAFPVINTLLIMLSLAYSLRGVLALSHKKITIENLYATILLPFLLLIMTSWGLLSWSPDLPVIILILLMPYMLLPKSNNPMFLYGLSIFLFTIKLSALPIILITAWSSYKLLKKNFNLKTILILLGIGSIIVLPWLVRNIVTSGYLTYPIHNLDLFNVDWKVPKAIATYMIDNTRGWARIKGLQMPEVQTLGFYNWFTHWFFQNIFSIELDALFLATLIFLSSAWSLRKTIKKIPHYPLLLSTFILGVVFWFMSAPETRYGLGWICGLASLLILPVCLQTLLIIQKKYMAPAQWAYVIFCLYAILFGKIPIDDFNESLLQRTWQLPQYPIPQTEKIILSDQVTFLKLKQGDQCWETNMPCAAQNLIQLRGKKLQDGLKAKLVK
jgi:hypothetical protein